MIALLIAVVGLYGSIAYNAVQRRREIGERMALAAGQVRSLVLRQGLRLAGIGLFAGVPIAVPLALALRSLLLVTPIDAIGAVLVLLGGAAALASFLPARAASGVEPTLPLRES